MQNTFTNVGLKNDTEILIKIAYSGIFGGRLYILILLIMNHGFVSEAKSRFLEDMLLLTVSA
jgi:hypothetical protein